MQALDDLQDGGFLAFDMGIDAAIRAIAHPAGNAQFHRLLAQPDTKKDALNAPGHADVPRDLRH